MRRGGCRKPGMFVRPSGYDRDQASSSTSRCRLTHQPPVENTLSIASGPPFRQPLSDGGSPACLRENSHAKVLFPLVTEVVRGVSMTTGFWRVSTIAVGIYMVGLVGSS